MGNCLPHNNNDDVSLLRSSESEQTVEQNHAGQGLMQPVFYPIATVSPANRQQQGATEEDQIKIAKRIGLIQHLPMGTYNGSKKSPECVICMIEFCVDEQVRFLPCMHIYHVRCIDDWLMRSLTCPSCMEPVDAALLNSYDTT